jgi:hypothetical protein
MAIDSRSIPHTAGPDLRQTTGQYLRTSQRDQLEIRLEERREALLCELVFAAKALADANLRYILPDPFVRSGGLRCTECKQEQRRFEADSLCLEHTQECRTGQVHRLVQSLIGLQQLWPPSIDIQNFIYRQVEKGGAA